MARPLLRSILGCWLVAGLTAASARGDAWTDALFPEKSHDFGMVPRGVKVKHDFPLVNRLSEPITIVNLRPSCGCTSGKVDKPTVAPGETTMIEAEMDTRNFVGPKATVLFVTLVTASGREAEARLAVKSHILADIVLNPGAIDFGTVKRGQPATQVLTIDRINSPEWRFTPMVSATRSLNAQLVETAQGRRCQLFSFRQCEARCTDRIVARRASPLEQRPRGTEHSRHGDRRHSRRIDGGAFGAVARSGPFLGRRSGPLCGSPSRPFAIRSIEGAGDGFVTSSPDGTRQAAHVVTVAYKPDEGTTAGDVRRVFRVHTDLPGEPALDLTATLHVVP